MIQNAGDFLRRIEPATIGIHVEDDRGGARRVSAAFCARRRKRASDGRNFPLQRNDDDVAPADHFARLDHA